MRLRVVHDSDGQILAAVRLDRTTPLLVRPHADEDSGQRVVDVQVPADYRHEDVRTVCEAFMIDHQGPRAALVQRR